ncbi:hypothetical protein ACI65C_004090 [Semiaphis heraclei]
MVATISNLGATNEATIKILHADTKVFLNKMLSIDMIKVLIYFMGMRNKFITKTLIFTTDDGRYETKWQHIIDLYKLDSTIPNVKILPQLSDYHVLP